MTEPSGRAGESRPAYRMFEGDVTPLDDGEGWLPWVRAIPPDDVPRIVDDQDAVTRADFIPRHTGHGTESMKEVDSDAEYVDFHLGRARRFLRGLEVSGRGFAYMIG